MSFLSSTLFLIILFLLEIAYFKVAGRYNIIDRPNHRSSHSFVTIRGGGIIFGVSLLLFFSYSFVYPYFIIGLFLIALISFLDDIHTLNSKIRLSIHLLSVLLMFYQWNLFSFDWYWILIAIVVVIGTINAYNFMDGINGITGAYSLLVVGSLFYINKYIVLFTSTDFLIVTTLSLTVFSFFNFRIKAKCFAGDVGSVSIAFIIIFLIGQLILKTQNFNYILLLLLYGLDSMTTICFRAFRKENIFEAHRTHFYQHLANERKWPHLLVSCLYFGIQWSINIIIVFFIKDSILFGLILTILSATLFLIVRFLMEGKNKLMRIPNGN